jgi:hypothetical protein
VEVDLLITSGGTLQAFDKAREEAGFVAETIGVRQKLTRAKIVAAEKKAGLRWAR